MALQTIDVNSVSIAEAVRGQMAEATATAKGLASIQMALNMAQRYTGGGQLCKLASLAGKTYSAYCLKIDLYSNTNSARFGSLIISFGVGNANGYGVTALRSGFD